MRDVQGKNILRRTTVPVICLSPVCPTVSHMAAFERLGEDAGPTDTLVCDRKMVGYRGRLACVPLSLSIKEKRRGRDDESSFCL
jgi:hypothetical protein